MAFTRFGPGTVTYTVGGGTAADFAQEVKGGGVSHAYEEVGEATTYLDGTGDTPSEVRADSITLDCDFDLGAAGFYSFLYTNDLLPATIVYTPNAADGAKWEGSVKLKLPDGATADSFGAKLGGSITHAFIGPAVFTPSTATP